MSTLRKAVITAAGRGTRQYPATNSVQKELFPLVDVSGYAKPTLQIIVEECLASGIDEVCIVANPANLPILRAHFRGPSAEQLRALAGKSWAIDLGAELAEMEKRITFVVQDSQEGYGHAVYQAKDWVGDEPFLLLLGDHVYLAPQTRCARQVSDVWNRLNAPVSSVVATDESIIGRFGVVQGQPISPGVYKIEKMVEKPSIELARAELRSVGIPDHQYLCFFGIHAFPPDIFDKLAHLIANDIRQKGEIQLTSAQQLLVRDSPLYAASTVNGTRFDMGVPEGLIETQVALALASPLAGHVALATEEVARIGVGR
jgi:UTP--glucose-1-phosphate uridylyltransferase